MAWSARVDPRAARAERAYDGGGEIEWGPRRLLEENFWRAIRHGLDGELIDLERKIVVPARTAVEQLVEYVLPVGSAVEYAHLTRNIVHRDLKPANIMISLPTPGLQGAPLAVRVADFNVGQVHADTADPSMTKPGGGPGPPFLPSPGA